jgi:hypothetical protein
VRPRPDRRPRLPLRQRAHQQQPHQPAVSWFSCRNNSSRMPSTFIAIRGCHPAWLAELSICFVKSLNCLCG